MKKLARTEKPVRPPKRPQARPKVRAVKWARARLSLREEAAEYPASRDVESGVRQAPALVPPLTKAEAGELARCEEIIRRGWQSFVEVGEALVTIRDKQLYRPRYKNFEDYHRAEWQYQKSQVYRLMEAAKVVRVLSPIGENPADELPLPTCEAQVRSLVGLKEAEIKSVWKQAAKAAQGQRITARLVKKQVCAIAPTVKQAAGKETERRPRNSSDPFSAIEKALEQLVEIVRGETQKHAAVEKLKRQILQLVRSGP